MAEPESTGPGEGAGRPPTTDRPAPLIVVMDRTGTVLPPVGGSEEVRLGPAELHWLQVQVGGPSLQAEGVPLPDADAIQALEDHLVQRGGFSSAPAASSFEPAPSGPLADGEHRILTPVAIGLSSAGFDIVGHDGVARARLDARQLAAATAFAQAATMDGATAAQRELLGEAALSDAELDDVVRSLAGARVLVAIADDDTHAAEGRAERELRQGIIETMTRAADVKRSLDELAVAEAERQERTGVVRTKVVPVNSEGHPILSLGLAMAHAEAWEDGRLAERYEFVPDWADCTVPNLTAEAAPAVYLFSNYIWSHAWNVVRSAEVKERNPRSVTVHGGPNTPKYEGDVEAFFRMNTSVDIAVHGEGEATFVELLDALQPYFDGEVDDLSGLRDVAGLTFRLGDEIVQTGKRDRIAELDIIPSPYSSGIFDNVGDTEIVLMTVETNRGCPYGCTFCDWGSATLSRIRKFDLDRVFADLEWCAKNKVKIIFCADANFGIFARDVDIARKVVELKERYGYPRVFESSYAKNTVKHLREIIEILSAGGVLSTGTLSLQSLDPGTLDTIRRSNIRVDKYEDLAVEFGNQGLPLVMELMMGLPGSTLTSYLGDLQQIIDREVRARVNPTEVLMNSPMNDPEYRDEHKIETIRPVNHDWAEDFITRKKALIVSTETYTRDEYQLMDRYRVVFLMCENYAVLRQLSRFVRQETGMTEMEFYVRLSNDLAERGSRWPTVRFTFDTVSRYMVPPVSWTFFIEELRSYLVDELGIADDSSLDTVLAVQHALLPARDRVFPEQLNLAHDYGAWHQAMLNTKRSGSATDWQDHVPHLRDFGPALFEVDDPQSVTVYGLGMGLDYDTEGDWELASPVARPIRFRHTIHA